MATFDMNNRKSALLSTILAAMLWGTSFPAIKIGLVFVDPYTLVFFRMVIASVLVLIISLATRNLATFLVRKPLIWCVGLLNGLAYLIQYIGMDYTTASKSSLLVNSSVVWVAFLSWFILKEAFSKKKVLGIASGLVGVFLLTTNLNPFELVQGAIIGDSLVLTSGVIWSFFIVYNKKIADVYEPLNFMPWVFLITTLPLIPFTLLNNSISTYLPAEAWVSILYTAIFCWLIPYYLWSAGLKHISTSTSTVILLIEVIVAILVSFIFMGESFTIISWVGTFLIFLAILQVSGNQ